MKISPDDVLLAFRRIQEFLDAHADVLGAVANGDARKTLDSLVQDGHGQAATRNASATIWLNATKELGHLRMVLMRDHVYPLTELTDRYSKGTPVCSELGFRRGKLSHEQVYAKAMAIADAVEPDAAMYKRGGMKRHFLSDLRAAAEAMIDPLDERMESRRAYDVATKALKSTVRSARSIVRQLDADVRRALKDDPVLLDRWDRVKSLSMRGSKSRKAGLRLVA